jgi:hypothetical protein
MSKQIKATVEDEPDYFKIAETLPPQESTKTMGWLLDYAKYRYSWVDATIRSIEGRAVGFLKAIATAAGAVWALFIWGLSLNLQLGRTVIAMVVAALVLAAVAVCCCAAVLIPQETTVPMQERAGFACVLDNAVNADPEGRFAAHLAYTTEEQERRADTKGRRLLAAYWTIAGAVLILLAALVAVVCACWPPISALHISVHFS